MRFEMIQRAIDILRGKRKPAMYYRAYHKRLQDKARSLKSAGVIRVAFLYKYSTDCQALNLLNALLQDKDFRVCIIINPDVARWEDTRYEETKAYFVKHYGESLVRDGYDSETQTFRDYTGEFDLMIPDGPYESMSHDYFKISYWADRGVLVLYISYFYMGRCPVSAENMQMEHINKLWLFCVENPFVVELAKENMLLKGKNVMMSGYPKMDSLQAYITQAANDKARANIKATGGHRSERKRVIISPHHSFYFDFIGAFMYFYEALVECMEEFCEIDFVFRPHPLLKVCLSKEEHWGVDRTQKYFDRVCSLPNVEYSMAGDYLDEFARSDALIHDCGSFMAEYLYTNKPCAFMYRKDLNMSQFMPFGLRCLEAHYSMFDKNDIVAFLREVVLDGKDSKQQARHAFATSEVMINYPHATQTIHQYLRSALRA